jgi:hypothetical protein
MTLITLSGDPMQVNKALLFYAAKNTPSLFIDCASMANPHILFPHITEEEMSKVYVMQAEITYKFRDILKRTPIDAKRLNAKVVVITTFKGLFHYQDAMENESVAKQSWELMKNISKDNNVVVGVHTEDSLHEEYADERWDYGSYCREPKNRL